MRCVAILAAHSCPMTLKQILSAALAIGNSCLLAGETLIDDFTDDLSAYTSTVVLDANGGGSNNSLWQISNASLELRTINYNGIEQEALIRNGLALAVGEELQADFSHNGASQDIGLYVGGTTPVSGTREDYIAIYVRAGGQIFSRGFDGTSEYGLVGGASPAFDKLFIARTAANTYEAGYYDGAVRNVVVTRTPSTPNDGDVCGFYADVRASGTLGVIDNLNVFSPTAELSISIDGTSFASSDPQGSTVGVLSASLSGVPEASTFALVPGIGDTDNSLFQIGGSGGDELQVNADFSPTGENPSNGQSYFVRVRGTDNATSTLSTELELTLTVFKEEDVDQDGLPDAFELLIIDASESDLITTIADVLPGDDFDNDGFAHAEENLAGSDPTDSAAVPGDGDSDGLSDKWEDEYFGDASQSGSDDPDGDGHNNAAEQAANTDPNDPLDYPGASIDATKPSGLMVELLAHPHLTTIPDTQPAFTWIFHPKTRGESQSAYEIIVSSTAALAGAGTGDVLSTGKTPSNESVNVAPFTTELTRGTTFHWRVRTWGKSSTPSAWSKIQRFEVEATIPQSGARSISRASANDATGYDWAGRYQSAFNEVVQPVKIIDKGSGNYFIDFGKADFGYITVRLNGSFSGQNIQVRFGEKSSGNSVDTSPGYTIRYSSVNKPLTDGDITYEVRPPTTTFPSYADPIDITGWAGNVTPFRYVELIGCPATVTLSDIRQHTLSTPFDPNAAAFTSSNATLDAVWDLCKHSIKATTFCAAYVDGDRERTAYEADAYINQLSHYGLDREFTVGRYSYEFLLDHPTWPTEWGFHFPLMAWADYMQTGNAEALAANYESIKDFLLITPIGSKGRRSDGLYQGTTGSGSGNYPHDIVDWPSNQRDGYQMSNPVKTVTSAFHYKALAVMEQIATVLGNDTEAATFGNLATATADAINANLWDGGNNRYLDGASLVSSSFNAAIASPSTHSAAHANFFPLALGIEAPDKTSVLEFLKSKRMSCSVYGSQYLLEALFEGDEADHAIGLMKDDDPSYQNHWWNMITEGSTITMESWDNDQKANIDWNHAWGAAPANIIPRYVLGLKPLTAGFGNVEIKPQPGTGDGTNGLTSASGTIPTIRGPVDVSIDENSASTFKMRVRLPGNMTARILIPTKGHAGATVIFDGAVLSAPTESGRLVLENIPSGEHAIWLSDSPTPDEAAIKENWKQAMFGDRASDPAVSGDALDPDGDGQTNLDEFQANTDPLDRNDSFEVIEMEADLAAGVFELNLHGKQGRRYSLSRSINLGPESWVTVDSSDVLITDGNLVLTDDSVPDVPRAFYRAAVELP